MNLLDNERVIACLEVGKEVTDLEVVKNIVANLAVVFMGGIGGEVPTRFNLTVTEKHLYIEAIALSTWGRLPETQYIEKISFNKLNTCRIVSEGDTDLIIIPIKEKGELVFKRKREKDTDFAGEVIKLINEMIQGNK